MACQRETDGKIRYTRKPRLSLHFSCFHASKASSSSPPQISAGFLAHTPVPVTKRILFVTSIQRKHPLEVQRVHGHRDSARSASLPPPRFVGSETVRDVGYVSQLFSLNRRFRGAVPAGYSAHGQPYPACPQTRRVHRCTASPEERDDRGHHRERSRDREGRHHTGHERPGD